MLLVDSDTHYEHGVLIKCDIKPGLAKRSIDN
jgi:hypothetical protein